MDKSVFRALKNPRILTIAVNLIDARDIEKLELLSVGRLLFEHLRTSNLTGSTNLSPTEFAKTLSQIVSEYISRHEAGEQDDLMLFDTREHSRLSEVSYGRYFQPVGDNPDRYEIVEEGLQLSLGIWIVHTLETEHRIGRDPFGQPEVAIEPLTVLDVTANIVGSGTEVACLTESCPAKVTSALIRHYVSLQNLPDEKQEAFCALLRKRPAAFVMAARDAALAEGPISNSNWLDIAILRARDHDCVRSEINRNIPEWLSYYSLAPERMVYGSVGTRSAEEIRAERQRVIDRLEGTLRDLTVAERNFIDNNLVRLDHGDLDRLHRSTFFLLAGLPLEQFAQSLFAFAFSTCLTPTIHSPNREFEHLVRFNYVDWAKTQPAYP